MAYVRIKKEFAKLVGNPIDGCTISLADNFDLFHWQATIFGPEDSVYGGGIFHLDVVLPGEYPMSPPKCTFKTKIYHPNIDSDGKMSLDILQDKWSPALQISAGTSPEILGFILLALKSILILLTSPNFCDPLVPSISNVYNKSPAEFEAIAREWTQKYAI